MCLYVILYFFAKQIAFKMPIPTYKASLKKCEIFLDLQYFPYLCALKICLL